MREEGEKNFDADRVNRALVISNSILTVVSIILMVIDIFKTVLFH
jgi:hypothetical protein